MSMRIRSPAAMEDSSHEDSVRAFWAATEENCKSVIDPEFLERIQGILVDLPRELRRIDPEIAGTLLALRKKLEETQEICKKYNSCCQNLIDYFMNERLRRLINESIKRGEKTNIVSFFQELRRRQGEITETFVRFEELVVNDKSWGKDIALCVQGEQNRYIEGHRQKDQELSKCNKKFRDFAVGAALSAALSGVTILALPLLCIFSYIAYDFYKKKKQTECDLESLRALEETYLIVNGQFSDIYLKFEAIHSNLQICHSCMDNAEKIIMRIIDNRVNALEIPVEQFNTECDIQELEQTFDELNLHAQTAASKQENLEMDSPFDLMRVPNENQD